MVVNHGHFKSGSRISNNYFYVVLGYVTVLLIAEVKIMVKQIKKGPEEEADNKPVY